MKRSFVVKNKGYWTTKECVVAKEWRTRHRNDLLRDSSYDGGCEIELQILTAAHLREFGSGRPANVLELASLAAQYPEACNRPIVAAGTEAVADESGPIFVPVLQSVDGRLTIISRRLTEVADNDDFDFLVSKRWHW